MFNKSFLPYHLVNYSFWPICCSMGVYGMLYNSVVYWHYGTLDSLMFCLLLVICCSFLWWLDVSNESFEGWHSDSVIFGLRLGMLLFILSEVFFFFSFFWSFFHNCWTSGHEVGWVWPPVDFKSLLIDPFSVPLLNTLILLSSGVTMTLSHHMFLSKDYYSCFFSLAFTVFLGFYFLFLQICEYSLTLLCMKSYVYGTMFFLLTGFHGMHVTVGAMFLFVCLFRLYFLEFKSNTHMGFECAAWYWHFVDVVWIFLYFFVYWYSYLL